MFWADQITADIEKVFPGKKSFIVRDEKTPSGRVHVGSLRGVVIHGIVAQALVEKGFDVKYFFELNDADPMDGLPIYLSKNFEKYMGRALKNVPPPNSRGEPDEEAFAKNPKNNYAEYFGNEFKGVIEGLGFHPLFYRNSEMYAQGKYDFWIDVALENPEIIRRVYREVSGSEKGEEWNAVQIVCEKCGRVGTTTVVDSSGERGKKIVEYTCEPDKVKWAQGCGYIGKISPYKGRGKLPWKVEWAAKWQIFPVDIEGAGKDHGTSGGSRDVAAGIVKEVFKGTVPFDIPYEFFLFGGGKMSSSKGLGASAKEVSDTLPPRLLRFLMARAWPHQTIDFDPSGETMPRLYDQYDEAANIFFGHAEADNAVDIKRAFHFSQIDISKTTDHFLPRFSRVAFTAQMPNLDFWKEMEKLKGAKLTDEDRKEAEERSDYAKKWLEKYAPEHAKFIVQEKALPEKAKELNKDQRDFLRGIANLLNQNTYKKGLEREGLERGRAQSASAKTERGSPEIKGDRVKDELYKGQELHSALHELRKKSPLQPKEAFQAIYCALLGKDSGPQAGWFLESLDKKFVIRRFEEIATLPPYTKPTIADAVSSLAIIRKEVLEKFPGIKLGFNILKGVKISASHPDFPTLQQKLFEGLDFEALKKKSPRLEGFKEIYRGFGVKPSNIKPSPVALISRLANGKPLPTINIAVDIYNSLAVKHQLAIGVFNLDKIRLPIELKFAKGGEMFQGLGMEKEVPLMAGELCYFDADGFVMARDFNYLDAEKTKVDETTTNLFLNVDGNHNCTLEDVEKCLAELEELLQKFCGGTLGKRLLLL